MYCKAKQPPGGGAVTDSHKWRRLPVSSHPPTRLPLLWVKETIGSCFIIGLELIRHGSAWEMSLGQAMLHVI